MDEMQELILGLTLELRRGTIVLCVLSQLDKPMYGYSLVQQLEERGIPVEAGTLYPLLRRLEGQQLLKSMWETSGAKPRKYYVRTEMGDQVYKALYKQWENMVASIGEITSEGGNQDAHQ